MALRTISAEDRFGFRTSGTVRIRNQLEMPLVFVALVIALLGAVAVFSFVGVMDKVGLFNLLLKSGVSFVWVFLCFMFASWVMTGSEWNYEADEKQFRLRKPNVPEEVFYYEDIEELRFTPIFLFWIERGYRVIIRTKYREFTYHYIYTKNRVNRSPDGSPFYIIAERSGLIRANSEDNTIIYARRTQT